MSTPEIPLLAALWHVAAAAAVSLLILRWCRDIAAVDPRLGFIVRLGVLARLVFGAGLFWVSYLDWAPLASLHSGDGFWEVAPDARWYFVAAATAAHDGLTLIKPGGPSPAFLVLLAIWMRLVGTTPTAAVLLNALLAVGSCRLVVAALGDSASVRARRAALVAVTGLSLSPALVLFAAQGLKDQLTITLLTLAALGVFTWFDARLAGPPRRVASLGGWLMFATAILVLAGVRPYLAFILLAGLGVALAAQVPWPPGHRLMRTAGAVPAFAGLWLVFMVGAGPYYQDYGGMLMRSVPRPVIQRTPPRAARLLTSGLSPTKRQPQSVTEKLEGSRAGFIRSAGATALATGSASRRVERFALGLAAVLLPITLLKALGVVDFDGGRGLLAVADIDLVVHLVLVVAAAVLLAGWLRQPRHGPYLVYAVTAFFAVALPMAYVVTNFGTLFRLRLMAFALVWLALLALARPSRPVTP